MKETFLNKYSTIKLCVIGISGHGSVVRKDALYVLGVFLGTNSGNNSRTHRSNNLLCSQMRRCLFFLFLKPPGGGGKGWPGLGGGVRCLGFARGKISTWSNWKSVMRNRIFSLGWLDPASGKSMSRSTGKGIADLLRGEARPGGGGRSGGLWEWVEVKQQRAKIDIKHWHTVRFISKALWTRRVSRAD